MENYTYQYFSEDSSTDREIGTVIITNEDEDETVIAEYTFCVNHITYNYRNPNYSNRHSLNFNDKKTPSQRVCKLYERPGVVQFVFLR